MAGGAGRTQKAKAALCRRRPRTTGARRPLGTLDPAGSSEEVRSFTIITTNANAFMEPIHERMPVILSDADMDCWLDPDENNPLLLSSLLKPAGENMLALIEQEALGVQ